MHEQQVQVEAKVLQVDSNTDTIYGICEIRTHRWKVQFLHAYTG